MASQAVVYLKDPDATLDYINDWSQYLASGETIAASSWITSSGITVGTGLQASSYTTTSATIWLSGGSPGQPYLVSNQITTSAGRVDERQFTVRVQDR